MTNMQKLLELFQLQLQELQSDPKIYKQFLEFAVPMYKYPFSEVVLTFAQRPSATLCGEFEFWTKQLGLSIRAGAKGIPVIRNFYGQNRTVYLFDIADVREINGHNLPIAWNTAAVSQDILSEIIDHNQNGISLINRLSAHFTTTFLQLEECQIKQDLLVCDMLSLINAARAIILSRLGQQYDIGTLPTLATPKLFVAANNIIFSTAKSELTSIKKQIDEIRRGKHEQKAAAYTGASHTRQVNHAEPKHEPSPTVRQVWSHLDTLHGGELSTTGDGNAVDRQILFDRTAGEHSLSGADAGHRGGISQDKSDGDARQSSGTNAVNEQLEVHSSRDGDSRYVSESPQLTLFSSADVTPDVQLVEQTALVSVAMPLSETETTPNVIDTAKCDQTHNYHITDEETLYVGAGKLKYKRNVEAVELLKAIEDRGTPATPEELSILNLYSGWGGIPQAFDSNNEKWSEEYCKLLALLSPKEYTQARASTLNAHYTSPLVVKAMYKGLQNLGFHGGRVCEPAMGVGYFFGLMPEELSSNCELHGVELDSITGRISKQLYPQANIHIKGFQETSYPDGHFDVMIGNVPFGDYNISDSKYSMHIHDYFFVKGLDKLHAGGLMAFITSKGTLDKVGSTVRRQIAQRADLLGAIRLPNSAFRSVAGTDVTTDIIFLQRRASPPEEFPEWVHLGVDPNNDNININSYFADNPQKMLGQMVERSGMYGGKDTALMPSPDWQTLLYECIDDIKGQYVARPRISNKMSTDSIADLPHDDITPRFTYCVKNGNLYYCDSAMLRYQSFDKTKTARVKAMHEIRQAVRDVIAVQRREYLPEELSAKQQKLTTIYDNFVKKHGFINSRVNQLAFAEDVDVALISSLEKVNEDGSFSKTSFFSEATIRPIRTITTADTPLDALLISLNEKGGVSMPYMESLTGLTYEKLVADLGDRIYLDHTSEIGSPCYLTAEEYLSGDVRTKLCEVQAAVLDRPELHRNVAALEGAQPEWISAVDIGVRLSSQWVGEETVNQFIYELLGTPRYSQGEGKKDIHAYYRRVGNEWTISNKSAHYGLITNSKYGTTRIGAYHIIEQTLNQREITIRDPYEENGTTKYRYNHEETIAARQKQELIEECYKEWLFADTERRNQLEHKYNHIFNRTCTREYDGSYITLPETNPNIELRSHQLNAIARIRTGSNTLLGHVVGAGKTFTMIAGGMELLRLGVRHKLLYVVPNHLIGDFAQEYLKLYPNAKILVPSEKDFEKHNRHRFIAKIATADIQAIIIGHSQFEKIDVTPERKAAEMKKEIDSLGHLLSGLDSDTPRYTIKQLEKSKQALMDKMQQLLSSRGKDSMLCFEDLGVDCLFVDEAHNYKNGSLHSKMSNIAGVSSSSSQKAADLLVKTRYLAEIGGQVIFASGTFISNSICEMYVMQRYLQEQTLHERDIYHFDEWASNFGNTVTMVEVKPEGGGHRTNTRFAEFFNLPELMNMLREVADIQTADMLNLPRPELEDGKPCVVACEPSSELLLFMDNCVERAKSIRNGTVQSYEDNMLKLTNEARKAGTDMRLLDAKFLFDYNGKLAACAQNIIENLEESKDFRGTVLAFSDIGTPNDIKFNVYDELKRLLVAQGVPEHEIVFIHEARTDMDKQQLYADMRSGAKRVLIGSTSKCGAGMNIQERLVALHHIDCPWRPSDIEQREGRILRQGNINKFVKIYRYVTKRSFDSYLWQLVEQKQRFISQVMTGKCILRTCKDIDDTVLSFAEVKAIATGDPRIKESMELQMDVEKMIVLRNQFTRERHRLQDFVGVKCPRDKAELLKDIEEIEADLLTRDVNATDKFNITLFGQQYDERAVAGEALQAKLLNYHPKFGTDVEIGSYQGFSLWYGCAFEGNIIRIAGRYKYNVEAGMSGLGNITRIENKVDSINTLLQQKQRKLESIDLELTEAQQQLEQPFPQADELTEKQQRLVALNAEINMAAGAVSIETTTGPIAVS